MRHHSMNDILAHTTFSQKPRRFQAVLLRIKLKINIMKQTNDAPVFLRIAVPQLLRIPSHNSLHRQSMLNMKRVFIVLLQ